MKILEPVLRPGEMSPGQKVAPHSFEAERAVLGSVLIYPAKLDQISTILEVDDFLMVAHREIFTSMTEIAARDGLVDTVVLVNDLRARGVLSTLPDGEMYLITLSGSVVTAEGALHYAEIVAEKSRLRRIIRHAAEVQSAAYAGAEPAAVLAAEHVANLGRVEARGSSGPRQIGTLVDQALDVVEQKAGNQGRYYAKTGLTHFDEKFHGLQAGYVVVAARPGQSKTSFVLSTMIRMAMSGTPGIFFSLEMGAQKILERGISFCSSVEASKLTRGTVSADDWKAIDRGARKTLRDIPLDLDDRTEATAESICAEIRRWAAAHDAKVGERRVKVAAIDSMSLLTLTKEGKFRADDVAKMSRMFKKLADKLGIVLILIVHLNRDVAKGKKQRKPILSDIRESGAIEQDADMVIFPYREPGQKGASTGPVDAHLIVAKHRDGAEGEVMVSWDARYLAFYDVADEP